MPTNRSQEPANQIFDMALRVEVCNSCLAIAKDCLETLNQLPEALWPEEYIKWLVKLSSSEVPMERNIARYLLKQVEGMDSTAALYIIMNKSLEAALFHYEKVQNCLDHDVLQREMTDIELQSSERFIKAWGFSAKIVSGIVKEAQKSDSSIQLTTLEKIVQHVSDITTSLTGEDADSIPGISRSPSPAPSTSSTVSARPRSSSVINSIDEDSASDVGPTKKRRKSV